MIVIDPDKLLDEYELVGDYDGDVLLHHKVCKLTVNVADAREVLVSINNHVCRENPK